MVDGRYKNLYFIQKNYFSFFLRIGKFLYCALYIVTLCAKISSRIMSRNIVSIVSYIIIKMVPGHRTCTNGHLFIFWYTIWNCFNIIIEWNYSIITIRMAKSFLFTSYLWYNLVNCVVLFWCKFTG